MPEKIYFGPTPEAFAAAIKNATPEAARERAKALWQEMRVYRPSAAKSALSEFRAHLRSVGIDDTILASERCGGVIPNALYDNLRKTYNEKLWQTHGKLRPMKMDPFLAKIGECLASKEAPWPIIMVGVMAATGRRGTEILHSGEFFSNSPEIPAGYIQFKGQAKTRMADGTKQDAYLIPVIGTTPGRVIQAILHIREQTKGSSIDKIQALLGSATRTEFGTDTIGTELKPSDLRAAYAAVCYIAYGKSAGMSPTRYYAQILGHKEGDMKTALSYMEFDIQGRWKPARGQAIGADKRREARRETKSLQSAKPHP